MQNKILIVDFGSQFTQLIARRIREANVYSEIHPHQNISKKFLQQFNPKGIILSGSPHSATSQSSPQLDPEIFNYGCPILGICYGEQVMCQQLGGSVTKGNKREFGKANLNIIQQSTLLAGINQNNNQVWMSHGDKIQSLPKGFNAIASSDNAPFAAIENQKQNFYGVQFHPEVTHTIMGSKILTNFTHSICQCKPNWTMKAYLKSAIENIRSQVGDAHVICGLSGGVDSAVTAVLIHQAIGEQLTCIFVDNGLLRYNEAKDIETLFRQHYNIPLKCHKGSKQFLDALKNINDPEKKRKIIGNLFIEIFEKEATKLKNKVEFLAQGTLYPDVIESVSVIGAPSVTIKSHHNVGGLPERMNLKLLEPLRNLFKDEVRLLGKELGLPDSMITRHPFPGPGLAVRVLGEVTKQRCDILRKADKIYIDELHKQNLYHEIWQAFAVLLPIQTVGVMGDMRTYDNVCALRAVTSSDGMTAESYEFPPKFLTHVATRIVNEVNGINRIVYDCTSKPPATIEWE